MSKLVYLYKRKKTDSAWSTVISELGEFLQENHEQCDVICVDNSNFKSLSKSKEKLTNLDLGSGDILIFNHAICFWLLFQKLIYLKNKGVKIVFLFHEHEHILGLKYCLKNIKEISKKEWLRHLKLWYKIPTKFSTHTVCLSLAQIIALGNYDYERISFLGIEPALFPEKEHTINNSKKITIMFPHDQTRFDKGNRFFNALKKNDNYIFIYGRDIILPYTDVYKKYHDSDIIFLPSDSESYSLVLAEALATNSCIITNSNVGIIQLLLSVFTTSELENYGLFVCHHSIDSYNIGLAKATAFMKANKNKTIELFQILKLDKKSAHKRFLSFIYEIERLNV